MNWLHDPSTGLTKLLAALIRGADPSASVPRRRSRLFAQDRMQHRKIHQARRSASRPKCTHIQARASKRDHLTYDHFGT